MFKKHIVLVSICLSMASAAMVGAIEIGTVPVGNPGNVSDMRNNLNLRSEGYGAVDYTYNIGKYPVTAGQYTAFLNAVAATDTYGLYNEYMANLLWGSGISRDGSPGGYQYTVDLTFANRPVNFVSWGDAARFANWLHHGQPVGSDTWITETGAYTLNGAMTDEKLMEVTRNADWQWAIPTEDEWYKAAYHKNDGVTGDYWDYPTSSDTIDTSMANYDWSVGHTMGAGTYNYPSPYGTFDQGGNVWEWNESILFDSYRGLRGGSFIDASYDLLASYPDYNAPTYEHSFIGFRVVEVPEPAMLLVFGLASVVLLLRRRT